MSDRSQLAARGIVMPRGFAPRATRTARGPLPASPAHAGEGRPRRLPDWEARLAVVLRRASARRYHAATFNCGLFAAAAIEAETGLVITAADVAGSDAAAIAETVGGRHGFPEIAPRLAARGDIVLARGEDEPSLAVVLGEIAGGPSRHHDGLEMIEMEDWERAWRI